MLKFYNKLLLGLLFLAGTISLNAQSTGNYTFTPATNGSLTDMSAGTTQLIAAAIDDGVSAVTNIGFQFWFMGARYTQFSVNSNGYMRLGGTVIAGGQYVLGTAGIPLIASLGSDETTSLTGKVHYKVTGTAPNRVLVVEFRNMTIIYDGAGTTADGTSQVRLYETSDAVELAYGSMNRNSSTGYLAGMDPQHIGFSTNNTANNYATITNATNVLATSTGITSNQNTLGAPMPNLNSVADGSRTLYTFTPVATNAPGGLNFTAVLQTSMTLNWTDNSADEAGFAIYRSDDGGTTYNYITTAAANATSYNATALTHTTNYSWRVYAVRESLSSSISGSQATLPPGFITSNGTGGGLWSATSTWSTGVVPTAGDNVTIANGDAVTIDVAANALSLTVGQGAATSLTYEATTARTLSVALDVTIAANATFATAATGAVTTHALSVGGSLTNNGTLDFSTNGNTAGASITFTGAANNTFGGSGPTTNIRTLVINKGTSNSNILELNPSAFTVQGGNTDAASMAFLTLSNGTIKISGTYTLSGRVFPLAAYTIGGTTGFWLNNPNFTVSGQGGSPTLAGLFRMSQGAFNVGIASNNAMIFSAGSNITVEGGAINAAGRFAVTAAATAITYTQTGGTITVCTVGNTSTTLASFDLGTSTASVINISGGTIVCQLASTAASGPRDYRHQAGTTGTTTVTSGTLQLGNVASGTAKAYSIAGVLPNLVMNNASAGHSATFLTPSGFNNVTRNITINTGNTINFGNFAFLFNGATLTNNGTLTHNGASSNFVVFLATAPVTYTGTGVVTAPMTNLALQCDQGFIIDPASPNIVAGAVRLFSGNVTNANKITVGNGGTTTAVVQVGNTTTPTAAGNFDVPLTFNPGTGGVNVSYLRTTTVSRNMSNELPPSRILTTLAVDDNDVTHSLTLQGGNLAIASGATPAFTFTNGIVNLNGSTLTLGLNATTAALAGAMTTGTGAYMYNGSYKRFISATTGNRDFPMGIATAKKNASINFTTAPTTGGSLTAHWSAAPPNFPNASPLVEGLLIVDRANGNGSWFIDAADGLSGGNYTGTFTANGTGNIADYTKTVLIKRPSAGGDWVLDGTHVTTTGSNTAPVLQRTGMTDFSEFAIGGTSGVLLPINISYFRGARQNGVHNLDWKVNVTSSPTVTLTLERSADSRSFSPIYNTTATDTRTLQPFAHSDNQPLNGINYYRLKMTDVSGKVYYSGIVALVNGTKGFDLIGIAPNPVVNGSFKLNITSATALRMDLQVSDMQGKIVMTQTANVSAGSGSVTVMVDRLAAGTYNLYGITPEGKTKVIRFVKN